MVGQTNIPENFNIEGINYNSSDLSSEATLILKNLTFAELKMREMANNKAIMTKARNAYISEIKKEITIFIIGAIFFIYVSSIGIYHFEHKVQPEIFKSVFHSMWWAVTTLTTVGYGDMYPVTTGGKIFTTIIVFIGMGMIAVPTGLFASALSKTFKK